MDSTILQKSKFWGPVDNVKKPSAEKLNSYSNANVFLSLCDEL